MMSRMAMGRDDAWMIRIETPGDSGTRAAWRCPRMALEGQDEDAQGWCWMTRMKMPWDGGTWVDGDA